MGNEKLYTLIKAPIITEQTASLGENLKQVVFKVDLSANKREIKKAVEELFKVEVLKVTTSVVKGKTKGIGLESIRNQIIKKLLHQLVMILKSSLRVLTNGYYKI